MAFLAGAFFAAALVAGAFLAVFAAAEVFLAGAFVALADGLREMTLRAADAADLASDFLVLRAMN